METQLTIQELEQTYIDDLNLLDDWMLQYEYLLQLASGMPRLPGEDKTEERKVHGCQSGVWLKLSFSDGAVHVGADSDAMIIRGMLAVIVGLLDGRTPQEIASYEPKFISETNVGRQISTDRFQGIHSVIRTVQAYARERL